VKHRFVLAATGLILTGAWATAAEQPSFETVEKEFRELPMEARRWTGPLFWLHGDESKERLEMYVGKVAEGGNGCFTAESRPHNDWLGEGWYRDLAICLDAAKKNNLKLWIFDEKWWPSGEVAGKVPQRYGSKRLAVIATSVSGPQHVSLPGCGGENLVGIVAGREANAGVDAVSLIDLAKSVRDGTLEWDAPAGKWKVMLFSWKPQISGRRYLVDGASRDCADWYIKTVYQPHYDRFKADFGKDIVGFFYDEPETQGDWGADVMAVLAERKIDWKRALVSWKLKLADAEEQAAAKYQYHDALAEAWGRTLFGGISRWCREHGVLSIGHFLEHGNGYLDRNLCAGNMFQLMKYSDMGAIDAVFDQFVWGKRVTRDNPIWQTPKLGSSITHAYGKPDDVTMVEIFGARGQGLTYPEMKWWSDHMQVSGVNFLIPHSFNPRSPRDTDCPPYFYNGGFEPRWPLYRVFADYTSRLSVMLSGGRHVCPVALLYLGNSAHVGRHITPEQISEALQDALYDCDWLPYEVFEQEMKVDGKSLRLREESYRILVVPPVEVIPYATLAKAKEFFDAGGTVVAHGFLPSRSATIGRSAIELAALREAIWGNPQPGLAVCKTNPAGGRSYLLPEKPTVGQLQKVLASDAGIHPTLEVPEGATDNWLHVLHRVKSGRDVFFITNQNLRGTRQFRFRIAAAGFPECWDAMRNEITSVPFTRNGGVAELTLAMEPNQSVLVVFQAQKRELPGLLDGASKPSASIALVRDAVEAAPQPALPIEAGAARLFQECSWVWYPEGDPGRTAPAETIYLRRQVKLPAKPARAVFAGTADNAFVLYINGRDAGHSDDSANGWRNPVELDVRGLLRDGVNQLALAATNAAAGDQANPAGLIGALRLEFDGAKPMVVPVDASWKCSREKQDGWLAGEFDDSRWRPVKVLGRLGMAPWGRFSSPLTLSPIRAADPFHGHCDIPADIDLKSQRVCLEMEGVDPELAARVTVNSRYAGGVIGNPLRIDITRYVKGGTNTLVIEPFAPKAARLAVYAR